MDPILQRAVELHQHGRFDQAGLLYEAILKEQPGHFETLHRLGVLRYQQGRKAEALQCLKTALEANPGDLAALSNAGLIHAALGDHEQALALYGRALAVKPDYVEALVNRGVALRNLGRAQQALASFNEALALRPGYAEAFNNRGNALRDLKRPEEALASYERAIAVKPDYAEAFNNRGNALIDLKRPGEALASFDTALRLRASYAEALCNRSAALMALNRPEEALASCDAAIALRPDYAEAHNARSAALAILNRAALALASCEIALALKPDLVEALNNKGNALRSLERREEALVSYDRAIALKPDYAEAYANRGDALDELRRFEEARASYEHALQLMPDADFLRAKPLYTRMKICDWRGYDKNVARLVEHISRSERAGHPFPLIALSGDPAVLRKSSEIWSGAKHAAHEPPFAGPHPHKDKIRIGYFSADFHQHATAMLAADLFESHDRSRFEIIAFSFGPETGDPMRRRMKAGFDKFLDVRERGDREVASLARELQVDIAIDLKGFTQDARTGIFAMRAAPLQVNYLGYPGTMGSPYIDYLIADRVLIPAAHQARYAEKIVSLPDSYQANDRKREISNTTPGRAELGLPEKGFVFCCFNNNYKIVPAQFESWMRILRSVDDAALWLLEDSPAAAANLRREATRRGVDPTRLVFAPRARSPEHLARHRVADLFLDTLPFNAHTTASDALWAGLPILTRIGETFAGRVAASLLSAMGLPELIAPTRETYEALAVTLAKDPSRMEGLKRAVAHNRLVAPLFDTDRFVRHIEAAYIAMHQRRRSGLPPDHIEIEPV